VKCSKISNITDLYSPTTHINSRYTERGGEVEGEKGRRGEGERGRGFKPFSQDPLKKQFSRSDSFITRKNVS
jgi:hypothetical protein